MMAVVRMDTTATKNASAFESRGTPGNHDSVRLTIVDKKTGSITVDRGTPVHKEEEEEFKSK
jgi:hypothetical protein